MQLIYNGKDITAAVDVNKADIIDTAGGRADSLELCMSDTEGIWSSWKPQKNDTVKVIQDGFSSGLMYVDELEQQRGFYIIRALSIPQESKTHRTKSWEEVRFLEFAGEIAARYGFTLQTYGVENYLYSRLDQNDQADFEFLAFRCMLEGYALKITDKKVVIYDERYMESQEAVKTVYLLDFDGNFKFKNKSNGIYGACRVVYGSIKSEYKASGIYGPVLDIPNIALSSQAEADRYAKNILRYHNKYEQTGKCTIQLDTGLAAGNSIQITGVGMADGKQFCEQVIHKLVEGKTVLNLRRPLEGY
ncbi:phage late control D family protein [Clostridium thermosuccinogenes]|uniref:phage late control D family protein n=1 Tax=Clostridium thermosuccinogenes TaxID=84032 RepID=UPI000CCC63F6|nr:hypothetical protein [Pseudoclostridium thermosuccinogenes]PNT91293.1 hypothetical protein CDQ83_15945 [Pseudoclostridium thermosuccinogenes]